MIKRETLLAASVAALCLATLACGDDPLDVGSFSVDGRWRGELKFAVAGGEPGDSARYVFVLELDQSGRDVSGSGQVQTPARTLDVNVDGRWEYPEVDLVLSAPEFAALFFDGTFATPDSLKGPLSGSGLDGRSLNLIRQR